MIDMDAINRAHVALKSLGSIRGPIIVGPWLSEVGFEVLYWVPWLRWAVKFGGLHPEDLYIVSRGGPRSWYRDIGAHYVDALDFYTPRELRDAGRRRVDEQLARAESMGMKHALQSAKQHMYTEVDDEIVSRVCAVEGLTSPRVLHPSLMYAFFRPFWKRKARELYRTSTVFRKLKPPAVELDLPASFVAVKFYSSMALADTPEHRAMVQATVSAQVHFGDVVLLHSGTRYDDHGEFPIEAHPRVHRVDLPPGQNLDTQTAIIARSSGYVGTYGGFAYLAPFLGIPTLAIYGEDNFRSDHRKVMESLASTRLHVPFTVEPLRYGLSLKPKRFRRAA